MAAPLPSHAASANLSGSRRMMSGRLLCALVRRLSGRAAIVFNQEVNSGNTPRAIPNAEGLLVTSGHDGFYRFWEIETGSLMMEIDVRGQIDVLSHGFSPDGETLYYMAETGLISQIPTVPEAMIDTVRSSLTRTLTEDECDQYLRIDGCSSESED